MAVAAMDDTVSAAEANRRFAALLRRVRAGESFVVTSRGQPVARIVPVAEPTAEEEVRRAAAKATLFERLRSQPVQDVGPWTRDELYEE